MTATDQVRWVVDHFEGHEFVDHPDDPGGATKFGITLETWRASHPDATVDDLRAMTRDAAVEFLLDHFVLEPNLHAVYHDGLRLVLIDFAIHSGPHRAVQALQRALGVTADGILGPITAREVNEYEGEVEVLLEVTATRLELMARSYVHIPKTRSFAAGWTRRVASVLRAALS